MIPISLCMIVKNEEANLDKCLNSIGDYVDEIIVVDTGSKDKTKEVAYKYTDKVYDFDWVDDFSKARNFSISKATNDWILVLDADEFLIHFDKLQVQNFLSQNEKAIGRIEIILNFSYYDKIKEVQKSRDRIARLFNRKHYKYEGIIHEQIVPLDGIAIKSQNIGISVDHVGYMAEEVRRKNKWERNKKLLEKSIKENPNDPYLYYNLGKIHYLTKNYVDAIKMFDKAMQSDIDYKLEYAQDLVITYGYSLLNLRKYEDALKVMEYEFYYKNLADYYFLLGLIKMNIGKFEEAIVNFKKSIGKTEKVIGTSSYLSYYNLGVIYEVLGDIGQALSYYGKCGEYVPASKRINEIIKSGKAKRQIQEHIEIGNLEKAKSILNIIEDFLKNDPEIYSIKAVIFMMENKLKEARRTLEKGLQMFSNDEDLLYNIEYLNSIENTSD
ncbi:tetratricopeptide repeat-containing glycosyltransferase family 2 protein [Lutispora thermophila]|nr:TPR domain-containing glycosyltransferase [Lutispora thermophila]